MARCRYLALLIVLCGASLARTAQSDADQVTSESVRQSIADLRAQDRQAVRELKKAVRRAPEFRLVVIAEVMQLLDDSHASRDARQYCMNLLGEIQATEAIPVLVRHLDETTLMLGLSEWHFPAMQALHRIGPPAIPELSKALAESSNRDIRVYAAQTLSSIGGSEAQKTLEDAVKTEKDPGLKQMFQQSLRSLQQRRQKEP